MDIGFLLYPTARVKVDEDSSFWIIHELLRRGHRVHHFESKDLFWKDGSPHAFAVKTSTHAVKGFLPGLPEKKPLRLEALDAVFIRKEPPFDNEYLYALQLLETVKDSVFVLNDPRGLSMCNEKLFILSFPKHIPETLVTQDPAQARDFIKGLGSKAVVKKLNDKGGSGIFATGPKDESLSSLLEIATERGSKKIMIQRFIRENKDGDKRILILNGRILGALLRKPSPSDFRANLSVGGSMHRAKVTAKDVKMVGEMVPQLAANGLHFVGIDVIGDYLSEINVTSPSGIPEINAFDRVRLEKSVVDFIEGKLSGGF